MKKKVILWVIIFCACFSLSAQNIRDIRIHIRHVEGVGSEPGDNAHVRNLFLAEAMGRSIILMPSRLNADYELIGQLMTSVEYFSFHEYSDELFGEGGQGLDPSEPAHVLRIVVQDARTGTNVVVRDLIYRNQSEIDTFFPVLSHNIFNPITEMSYGQYSQTEEPVPEAPDVWRNRRFYAGAVVYWTPRIYIGDGQSTFFSNVGLGLSFEYHFHNMFSAETGLEFAADWINLTGREGDDYRDLVMEIPFVIKFVIKPLAYFMLEPYTGFNFNIPFFNTAKPPPVSWRIGFQYGVKAGPGVLVIDPRFTVDLGKSKIEGRFGGYQVYEYQRHSIYIGVGYKYGFNF